MNFCRCFTGRPPFSPSPTRVTKPSHHPPSSSAVVPEAGAVQHGAEEVQPRQQEGPGPVRQLLGAEGEADQAAGGARPGPQVHHGAHERAGAAQIRGHPAHLQAGRPKIARI